MLFLRFVKIKLFVSFAIFKYCQVKCSLQGCIILRITLTPGPVEGGGYNFDEWGVKRKIENQKARLFILHHHHSFQFPQFGKEASLKKMTSSFYEIMIFQENIQPCLLTHLK